jgi:hypothetical protein
MGFFVHLMIMLLPVLAVIWAFRLLWNIKKTTGPLRTGSFIMASVILLVLAVTLFDGIFGEPHLRTRRTRTIVDMEAIANAIEQYKVDHHFVPQTNVDGLSAVLTLPGIGQMPNEDGFGNPFLYIPLDDTDYVLISPGMGEPRFGRFLRMLFRREGQLDIPASERDSAFHHDLIIHNGTFIASPNIRSDLGPITTSEFLQKIGAIR